MTIRQYLERNALSGRQFAINAGLTPQYLSHVLTGRQDPSMQFAIKVHEYTKGQVNLLDNMVSDKQDTILPEEGPSGPQSLERVNSG